MNRREFVLAAAVTPFASIAAQLPAPVKPALPVALREGETLLRLRHIKQYRHCQVWVDYLHPKDIRNEWTEDTVLESLKDGFVQAVKRTDERPT